jgi:hypothetical protein
VPSRTWEQEIQELSGRLELNLTPDGTPVNPLVPVDLGMWRDAGPKTIVAAAAAISSAAPVTVGMLAGPGSRELEPLLDAVSVTITDGPATRRRPTVSRNPVGRAVVPTGDLLGEPSLDVAVGRLRDAVEGSPRAAVACGQLLRQTAVLAASPAGTTAALAAEAAAYSMLLAGSDANADGDDLAAAYLARLARAPRRAEPKTTSYASGPCVGADTETLAWAGHVVASRDAFFQLPAVSLGLVCEAGGSVSVTRRIGRHRAAWLMLTGDRLVAPAALAWGLIDEIA